MVYLIDIRCFLCSCDHLIPHKVEDGAASQNCGRVYRILTGGILMQIWSYQSCSPKPPSCLYTSQQDDAARNKCSITLPLAKQTNE